MNLENLFVIELIFVKENGNSIKYGFTTAEQVIGFLQGEIAAQQPRALDAATPCAHRFHAEDEKDFICIDCGAKTPRQ